MVKTTTKILKRNISKIVRKQVRINGIVQGVGFRPFIYNLAHKYNLAGTVSNYEEGVIIEVQGQKQKVDSFSKAIIDGAPPLSMISSIHQNEVSLKNETNFTIVQSSKNSSISTLISPDVAVCPDCINELFDPNDRRFLYPFINCTNCGPRYSIIENIPYDRPFTSMRNFELCPDCGPHVHIHDSTGSIISNDIPIQKTVKHIQNGKIVAIKGLGGFHLAVDANNSKAVKNLRERKHREEKPLAIMVKSLDEAKKLCYIDLREADVLTSIQSPIILLKKRNNSTIVDEVAPGNDRIGIMLPYTPLHHILFYYGVPHLVMTSANISEEPICIHNDEAISRLDGIADYFLTHNRNINIRSDDSVVIQLKEKIRPIRRSRGFAPKPIMIDSKGPTVLAVGGELKNTVCLFKDDKAFLSQHIGDLENIDAYTFFKHTIHHLEQLFEVNPDAIAHDLHPDYLSTKWVKKQTGVPIIGVQHHHAHLASCMAENQLNDPVIGLIMDGTGYGTDGILWGGEILIGDYLEFQRYAHFEPMPLPGGSAAIKAPWRTAVAYLQNTFGELPDLPFLENINSSPIVEMVEKNVNCPKTSSCGRLFDAVAAMSGGLHTIKYEGQAAIEFMQKYNNLNVQPFDYEIHQFKNIKQLMISPIIRSIVKGIQSEESIQMLSNRFHKTLLELFIDIAKSAKNETGISDIVLSGGVFQNHVIFEEIIPRLQYENFNVYTHNKVPMNDGGISLGQAMIARKQITKGIIH